MVPEPDLIIRAFSKLKRAMLNFTDQSWWNERNFTVLFWKWGAKAERFGGLFYFLNLLVHIVLNFSADVLRCSWRVYRVKQPCGCRKHIATRWLFWRHKNCHAKLGQWSSLTTATRNKELETHIHCILPDPPVFGFVLSPIISASEHISSLLYKLAT